MPERCQCGAIPNGGYRCHSCGALSPDHASQVAAAAALARERDAYLTNGRGQTVTYTDPVTGRVFTIPRTPAFYLSAQAH